MTEMIHCKLNGKWEIILPKHRADRPEWYNDKGWEKERLEAIHDTTKKGDVVYYVGAEEGDMCGLVSLWGAELVMFEPNPLVLPNIKAIWVANGLKAPLAFWTGFAANVTDDKGKDCLSFNQFPLEADGEVIGNHGFKELAYEADVIPQLKIDDLINKHCVQPPDMITMDVEGSEFEVLRGAEQTIIKHKPRIFLSLHPEFMFRMFGEYGYDLRHWIMDKGYKETFLDYQHEVHFYYEASE